MIGFLKKLMGVTSLTSSSKSMGGMFRAHGRSSIDSGVFCVGVFWLVEPGNAWTFTFRQRVQVAVISALTGLAYQRDNSATVDSTAVMVRMSASARVSYPRVVWRLNLIGSSILLPLDSYRAFGLSVRNGIMFLKEITMTVKSHIKSC